MALAHEGKDKETALISCMSIWMRPEAGLTASVGTAPGTWTVNQEALENNTWSEIHHSDFCYVSLGVIVLPNVCINKKQTNKQIKKTWSGCSVVDKLCWNRAATVLRNARGDQIHMISFSGSLCLFSGRSLDFSFWRTLACECSCIQKNKKEKMLKNPKISFGIGQESFSPLLPVSCHFENPQ